MATVPRDEFLTWAATVGVSLHPQFCGGRGLMLGQVKPDARFWVLPDDPACWPHFAYQFLKGVDPWSACYLWSGAARWPGSGTSLTLEERMRALILRAAGVPDGWAGALRFEEADIEKVVLIMYAQLTFGWCLDDDVFIVPDHGRQIIRTSHHDVVHVEFAESGRVPEFVDYMAESGYDLPTDVPDCTFKRPHWMPPLPDEPGADVESHPS